MSKLTLRFDTALGPRVGVLEVSDASTAQAILNAHMGQGNAGALIEEMPRLSLKDHLAKHLKKRARASLKVIASDPKVTSIRAKRTAK